ncbi:MAG: hypothetical protein KAH54_04440 [Candidatus Sabulitectum sp.]|nr:hypothetical protein [Candidatus Sabulitectum sp.]
MQSNENFDTYLTRNGSWILLHLDTGKHLCSNMIREIASSLNMQEETLVSLVKNTDEGEWPVLLGGRTFKLSSMKISSESLILSLTPVNPGEIADFLYTTTADELFVLISSLGKIITISPGAVSLFGESSDLASLFDSSSSGAIQAALKNCILSGSTQDILVSHRTGGGDRANYSLSMRKLPSPGKLIYCRLTVPSVAVVTRTMGKRSLISVLLEESFCPAFIIDDQGIITSMNEIARNICMKMWGLIPTGSNLFDFIHPSHRKVLETRHEQRNRGFVTTSRFSVKLRPSVSGSEISIDISVVPIPDTDQYVIFSQTKTTDAGTSDNGGSSSTPAELTKLLGEEDLSQTEIVKTTATFLGASSAAFVHDGGLVTVGDSRGLMQMLDPIQLAARSCGFQEDGIFIHRIHSGFGISHLVLLGIHNRTLSPLSLTVLGAASRVLGEQEARSALRAGHRILSTVKTLAEGYLKKTEPLDGLLSDLVKECRAETAVIYKINANGTALKGIGSSGVIGLLPELPVEALNTASWACLRGETAFFAETPEDDLRFSPVFPNSRSELAVPFFNGSTADGVILLASTETEAFHYSETELIQLMAILFTAPESSTSNGTAQDITHGSNALKQQTLEHILHNISALNSSSEVYLDSLERELKDSDLNSHELGKLTDSVKRLTFFSKWTLWWLKISIYNGSPEHRWINPVPLLAKVLDEFGRVFDPRGIELNISPPMNDIEVCTDGSFISMIAYSLLACILDYCENCQKVNLTFVQREDYWSFRFDTAGGSIPGECLSVDRLPEKENMAFTLAWKLTEELGGTVSTFSNKGKTTRMIIRLKVSG